MYLPFFSVALGMMLVASNAQDTKDGEPYPPAETSEDVSGSFTSLTPVDDYPNCYVLHPQWIGDGWCDSFGGNYNTEACGYDGGDCCECDCSHGTYLCGQFASYDCVDPESNCPSECSNGFPGFEGTNDSGTACCPLGCNQCGGAGCGQSGSGQDLDSTSCCINGVLRNQDVCSETGEAPCIIEPTCSDGTIGIEGTNDNGSVCCPLGCKQCGGAGCAQAGVADGLGNTDCCINGVLGSQDACAETGVAPCTL